MYELIIFDCDGTLIDSEIIACEVIPKVWAQYGVHFTPKEFAENFIGKGHHSEEVLAVKRKLPENINEIVNQELEKSFKDGLKLVPGMDKILKGMNTLSCVASNSSLDYVKKSLIMTDVAKYFGERVYSAYQVPNAKPSPDLFLMVSKTLGIEPNKCLVIEDSPSGIQAAKAASMQVIGFTGASHFTSELKQRIRDEKPQHFCENTQQIEQLIL